MDNMITPKMVAREMLHLLEQAGATSERNMFEELSAHMSNQFKFSECLLRNKTGVSVAVAYAGDVINRRTYFRFVRMLSDGSMRETHVRVDDEQLQESLAKFADLFLAPLVPDML